MYGLPLGVGPAPPGPIANRCVRLATNQRGELASLWEPAFAFDETITGLTSAAQGAFKFFAYESYGSGGGEGISWEYSVALPDVAFETGAMLSVIVNPRTWEALQLAIDNAPQDARIIVPAELGSLPMVPITISGGERRLLIDFEACGRCDYFGGDNSGSLIRINGASKVILRHFQGVCSENNRRMGINLTDAQDIDVRDCTLRGCLDGLKCESSPNTRIRFLRCNSLQNTNVDDIFGPGTASGYGGYFGGCTDLILDGCSFEAGDDSGQHALRIPDPVRCKIIDCLTYVSLNSAQKRCLWVFGATEGLQITNFTAVNTTCYIGAQPGDGQGTTVCRGVRIDGFTSLNQYSPTLPCLNIRCGNVVQDLAIRNGNFTNPGAPAKCIQVEWRDDGDLSHDIVWLPNTCTINGSPLTSSNWTIASDWTAQEASDRNIGPIGSVEYQQHIIIQQAIAAEFFDDEQLSGSILVPGSTYRSRSAANGGVSQQDVNCATGIGSGESISLSDWPGMEPIHSSAILRLSLSITLSAGTVTTYNNGIALPDLITGLTSGATGHFVRFESGTPGKIVLVGVTGSFQPGEFLSSAGLTAIGYAAQLGNPTSQFSFDQPGEEI